MSCGRAAVFSSPAFSDPPLGLEQSYTLSAHGPLLCFRFRSAMANFQARQVLSSATRGLDRLPTPAQPRLHRSPLSSESRMAMQEVYGDPGGSRAALSSFPPVGRRSVTFAALWPRLLEGMRGRNSLPLGSQLLLQVANQHPREPVAGKGR